MSGFNSQAYGITEPISLAGPTENDLRLTDELEQTLREMDVFEGDDEAATRQEVLGKLNLLVKEWVQDVAKLKNIPESMLSQVGGCIHTFGSYRLGVHGKGADIDTLCLTPRHVDREQFFEILYPRLLAREEVTNISAVPEAFVPVIKMNFSGISIDLIMAKLDRASVDESVELLNTEVIRNIDEVSVRSINGCRVTDQILKLVPNVFSFRLALRCIKQWAQRRGIYPNAMGFLGGIGWAMLIARTCQLYPNASASTLVSRFFRVYHNWTWPSPVLLKHIEDANMGMKIWNPKVNPKDGKDLMPIITPAYPSMNSSHNVMYSTLRLMKEEFERGVEVTLKIENGHATWHDLFTPSDFFSRHKNFMQVDATTFTEEEHQHLDHLLSVRVKVLVSNLERTENVEAAYPYIKSFNIKMTRAEYEAKKAGKMQSEVKTEISKEETQKEENGDSEFVWQTSYFVGLIFPPKSELGGPLSVDLSPAVADFLSRFRERYENKDTLKLSVHHVKRSDLPDFVWGDGEKPIKRKKKGRSGTAKRQRLSVEPTGGKSPAQPPSDSDATSSATPQAIVVDHVTSDKVEENPIGGTEKANENDAINTGADILDAVLELDAEAQLEAMKRELESHNLSECEPEQDLPSQIAGVGEDKVEGEEIVEPIPEAAKEIELIGVDESVTELTYTNERLTDAPNTTEKTAIKLVMSKK